MSTSLTRRDFLKLSGAAMGVGGLALLEQRGYSPSGAVDGLLQGTTERSVANLISRNVERGFQADSLPGEEILVADYFTPWDKVLPQNQELRAQFRATNYIPTNIDENGLVTVGSVLLVPEETGIRSSKETLARQLYRQLLPRLVMTPGVSPDRQFLPREFERLNDALHRIVVPYLAQFAPKTATTGLVLLGRAPDELAAGYAEDPSHSAVSRLDRFSAGSNAFTYFRDKSGNMGLTSGLDGTVLSRRIYLLREPSENLKAKISTSGGFLMDPEWGGYYFGTVCNMIHEAGHSIIPNEYGFSPFDTHNVIRALSFAGVLDYLCSGKGKWNQGTLPKEVWNMPELEVLKVYPTFYKDLFDRLRKGRRIGTTAFDNGEVMASSQALFTAKILGNFADQWNRWQENYDEVTHGQPIGEQVFAGAMNRIGEEHVAIA